MARGTIPTAWPHKGDLVRGHRVFAYLGNGLPAVPGKIVEATEATVVMEVDAVLGILGLPRRTRWTWRKGVGTYQQHGQRSQPGIGLLLDRRPKGAS